MITEEQFTAAMEAAVAKRGADYVYPEEWYLDSTMGGCVYQRNGEPACLIGVAMAEAGLPVPPQSEYRVASVVLEDLVPRAVRVAALMAQGMQDRGRPWGEALREYHDRLEHEKATGMRVFA